MAEADPQGASASLDAVFGALADPTRRLMVERLMAQGTTSVPALSAELPISRQAVAKHLGQLAEAGLIERAKVTGREVHYRLRPRALAPASEWMTTADAAWAGRLDRLRRAVEDRG